jgi:hypothetical protein
MFFDEILERPVELARLVGVKNSHGPIDQLRAKGPENFVPTRNNSRTKTANDMFFVFKIDHELPVAAIHRSLRALCNHTGVRDSARALVKADPARQVGDRDFPRLRLGFVERRGCSIGVEALSAGSAEGVRSR